jgi:hypothetical protein
MRGGLLVENEDAGPEPEPPQADAPGERPEAV